MEMQVAQPGRKLGPALVKHNSGGLQPIEPAGDKGVGGQSRRGSVFGVLFGTVGSASMAKTGADHEIRITAAAHLGHRTRDGGDQDLGCALEIGRRTPKLVLRFMNYLSHV